MRKSSSVYPLVYYITLGDIWHYFLCGIALITDNDTTFIKLIGDKYFTLRSLHNIIADYNQNYPVGKDNNGKKLYKMVCSNLNNVGIPADRFIQYLCEDICQYENFSQFISTLTRMLS